MAYDKIEINIGTQTSCHELCTMIGPTPSMKTGTYPKNTQKVARGAFGKGRVSTIYKIVFCKDVLHSVQSFLQHPLNNEFLQ